MKDVITNEMLRGAGSKLWSEGLRMRKLFITLYWIYRYWVANLENWNILVSRGKESKNDSLSSGERMGKSLNHTSVWGSGKVINKKLKEIPGRVYRRKWQSCIWKRKKTLSRVAWSTWNSVWISEDHLVRLNIPEWPIVKQYREGKVKRTPGGEWNRTWNHKLTSSRRTI